MSVNSGINDENIIVEDLDATQPMIETSPLQMSTPVRRVASWTNISPTDVDLTQSSPEERVSPEEKRGRFQRSPDHQRSSSLSNLSSSHFSDQNESHSRLNENADVSSGTMDLQGEDDLPLLQKEPFRLCDTAAKIMTIDIDKIASKICEKVPQICPGKTAAYLVDLTKLGHPEDIARDSYGSWGSNSGESFYYAVDIESKSVTRQNRGRKKKMAEDAKVDLKIRRRFYNHPQTNKRFKKSLYIGYFGVNLDIPKWAIISYEWLCDPFDFMNISHGNSKDQSKPFQPTAKSVINKLHGGAKYLTPQQNIHSITDETGTVFDSSPAFVPRNKKQARNVAYRVPESRKGKGGGSARTDYDDVGRMVFERPRFLRFFEPGKSPGSVRGFMGTDQSFHFGRKALVDGRGIMFADMTYRPCQKGYLTIISAQHPLLIDSETGRNVVRPIAFSLTTEKTTDDYRWIAEEFKFCIDASDDDFVQGWVTDGEKALINSFQMCSLFSPSKSNHLLCELHLKKPTEEKLKDLHFSKSEIINISEQIFGGETFDSSSGHRERKLGLVDCQTEVEFLRQLQVTKTLWDTMQKRHGTLYGLFSDWFELKQKKTIWNGYGYPMRKNAGLGDPPSRITNNNSEIMNRHIKDLVAPDGNKLPWNQFIPKLKRVVTSLFNELVSAVTGIGQYRIRQDVRPELELPKDDILQNVDASNGSENRDIPGIPDENWGEMSKKAAVYTQNKMVFQNPANKNLFVVFEESGATNVMHSHTDQYSLVCSKRGSTSLCKSFRDFGMNVCQHTLAVADLLEIRAGYEDFIKTKMATLTMTDLIASQVSTTAGDKPHQTNKRHRGGGASRQTHSTTVVRTTTGTPGQIMAAAQAQTRSMPDKLSNGSKNKPTAAQRAKLFDRKEISDTEPWYNANKFELFLTKDYFATSSLARFCWSCKTFITEEASPYDMVIVHKERFWIRDQRKWSAPNNLQNRLTHARYSCVIGKYPYFTPNLLEAKVEVKDKLTPEQERFLADHLGVDYLNH